MDDFVDSVYPLFQDSSSQGRHQLLEEIEQSVPLQLRSIWGFKLCSETLNLLVDSFKYDALSLRKILQCASQITLNVLNASISAKVSLEGLHIWNNIPIWVDMTDNLVVLDIKTLDSFFKYSRNSTIGLLGLSRSQLKLILTCSRILSVVVSMKSLGLKTESIETFYETVRSKYRLADFKVDVHSFSLNPYVNELVTNAVNAINSLPQHFQYEDTYIAPDEGLTHKFGYGNVKALLDIGYSPLVSLLYLPVYTAIVNGQISPRVGTSGSSPSVANQFSTGTQSTQTRRSHCICGCTINPWEFMSLPSADEMLLQSKLVLLDLPVSAPPVSYQTLQSVPMVLCERCYRSAYLQHTEPSLNPSQQQMQHSTHEANVPHFAVSSTSSSSAAHGATNNIVREIGLCPNLSISMDAAKEGLVHALAQVRTDDFEKAIHKVFRIPLQTTFISPTKSVVSSSASSTPPSADRVQHNHAYVASGLPYAITPINTQQLSRHPSKSGNTPVSGMPGSPLQFGQNMRSPREFDGLDDVSVMSAGFSKMDEDDVSVARYGGKKTAKISDIASLSVTEFHAFVRELWNGTNITLIYSNNPPIEKSRLLYLRSDSRSFNDLIVATCSASRAASAEPLKTFGDVVRRHNIPLYLGWARKSEQGDIKWNPSKSVAIQSIRNMKVGSKKWKSCIKLATDNKIIVIKIDEEDKFQWILRGLTQVMGTTTTV